MNTNIPIYLPKDLNLEQLLTSHPPQFSFKIDNFKYLINKILELPAWNKELFKQYDYPYVHLHSRLLKSIIWNYQDYLNYLVNNRVLEKDNQYIIGSSSKGYRLTEQYRNLPEEDIIVCKGLIKRITLSKVDRNSYALKQYSNLTHWFEDGIELNSEAAYHKLENIYKISIENSSKASVEKANLRYTAHKRMLDCIRNTDFSFVIDNCGHRLHSPLTNLKKEFRQFLTYKGQSLVSLDVSCSQPYLSACLFDRHFYEPIADNNRLNLYHLQENCVDAVEPLKGLILDLLNKSNLSSSSISILGPYSLPMCVKEKESSIKNNNFLTYINEIQTGTFYEYMQHNIVSHNNWHKRLSRDSIKALCLTTFFSNDNETKPYFVEQREAFRQIFPSVFELFALLKSQNHKTLAILLQNIESELILNRITRRITDERPDLPIFTIHDSIITVQGSENYIENVMLEELSGAIGIRPNFKREYWALEEQYSH